MFNFVTIQNMKIIHFMVHLYMRFIETLTPNPHNINAGIHSHLKGLLKQGMYVMYCNSKLSNIAWLGLTWPETPIQKYVQFILPKGSRERLQHHCQRKNTEKKHMEHFQQTLFYLVSSQKAHRRNSPLPAECLALTLAPTLTRHRRNITSCHS